MANKPCTVSHVLLTQFHRSNWSLAHCRNLVLASGLEESATPDAMVFGLPVCIAAPSSEAEADAICATHQCMRARCQATST